MLLGLNEAFSSVYFCEDFDVMVVVVVFLVTDNTNVAGLSNKLKGSEAVAVLPTLVISHCGRSKYQFLTFEFLKF